MLADLTFSPFASHHFFYIHCSITYTLTIQILHVIILYIGESVAGHQVTTQLLYNYAA